MYSTSTQKRDWTFSTQEEILELRRAANENFRSQYDSVIAAGEEEIFLTPEEEAKLCTIVCATGIKFSNSFRPQMWPSVRWIAFNYFKRFFLHNSTMEFSPKNIMMACFYLAAKVDEFNLSITEFLSNLQSGTIESNSETVLKLEPELMHQLNYHLTVHTPYRPFEGHLIDMKTHSLLGFDLEQVRPHANDFFMKCLYGDVTLLYSPSQIALAALKYALFKLDKSEDLLKEQFLYKLLEIDAWRAQSSQIELCEKLVNRINQIIKYVLERAEAVSSKGDQTLHARINRWVGITPELKRRLKASQPNNKAIESNYVSDED